LFQCIVRAIPVLRELCWLDAQALLPFRRWFRTCSKFEKIPRNDTFSIFPIHRDGSDLLTSKNTCVGVPFGRKTRNGNFQSSKLWNDKSSDAVVDKFFTAQFRISSCFCTNWHLFLKPFGSQATNGLKDREAVTWTCSILSSWHTTEQNTPLWFVSKY
jgi:hypothetical protein